MWLVVPSPTNCAMRPMRKTTPRVSRRLTPTGLLDESRDTFSGGLEASVSGGGAVTRSAVGSGAPQCGQLSASVVT